MAEVVRYADIDHAGGHSVRGHYFVGFLTGHDRPPVPGRHRTLEEAIVAAERLAVGMPPVAGGLRQAPEVTDWTTVAIAVITALAATGGAVGGQWVAGRSSDQRERAAFDRQRWESRRAACTELLALVEQLDARAGGAVLSRQGFEMSVEDTRAYLTARVNAELAVSPQAWSEMEPLLEAVQLRSNIAQRGSPSKLRSEAAERLREMGAGDEGGWEDLRLRYLAAVRRELALA